MGLSLATLHLVYLPCAISKATTTCTITPLRSLADQGGAFDVPKGKCPPDRGSSVCVTGSRAPSTKTTTTSFGSLSSSPESKFAESIIYPPTPPAEEELPCGDDYMSIHPSSSPTDIPRSRVVSPVQQLGTPPLTPDNSDNESSNDGNQSSSQDALDFLLTIFPREGLQALPYAKSVAISAPNLGATFDGVVLELPGTSKVLYVDGKSAQSVSLRESIVALLDLADECFQCSALVIALDKASSALGDIIHSFMYVGGTVVTKPPFQVDSKYLLVGMEI